MAIQRQPACVPPFLHVQIPPSLVGRDEAIGYLLRELMRHGGIDPDRFPALFAGLIDREALGSTSVGHGMAIPHLRVAGLGEFHVVRGDSPKGVSWPGALGGQAICRVYLVLSPQDQAGNHLRLLEYLSRVCCAEE